MKPNFIILNKLAENFKKYPGRTAFYIRGVPYSYLQFEKRMSAIQAHLLSKTPEEMKYIGILSHDHIDTYASIFAVLFSGKAFVPLNPLNPPVRNQEIIHQMDLKFILGAGDNSGLAPGSRHLFLDTEEVKYMDSEICIKGTSEETDVYVLFTSGSTGKPKGVRINRRNLETFYRSYISFGPGYSHNDRFLQIYDISFDGSVPCYLVALCAGASVYTVPQDEIKYLYALKLMKDHSLSVVKMTPSLLYYLRPFFDRIHLPSVRCSIFGGEALPLSLVEEWRKCVPNALIQNAYGPTEATIDSLLYNFNSGDFPGKSGDGVVSLGKSFGEFEYAVVNHDGMVLENNETGELCLHSDQVMISYWNDEERTKNVFIHLDRGTGIKKFYRTGDIVYRDKDGFYMYCGRVDEQVQIQGYRVELAEIEKHARDFLGDVNLAAVAGRSKNGNAEIVLYIGAKDQQPEPVFLYLDSILPHYMLPSRIEFIKELPRQVSGKTDRKILTEKADLYEDHGKP